MECAPDLSVILPSYLEEENLRLLLPRIRGTLDGLGAACEVLVIDTVAPLDNTARVCAENGVVYLNREGGDSFGDAVRSGIRRARGRYLLFMDADGSHPPEFIPELYRHAAGNDIVIASRYVEGGYTENSAGLVLMSKVLNVMYSVVLGLPCKDVSNSFKIYRRELLAGITLSCDNFDIVEEILVKIHRMRGKGLRIKEVPFSFKKRLFGHTKRNLMLFMLTYLYTLMKLRFGR